MIGRLLKSYWKRITSLHSDSEGFVLMTTLIVFFLLFIFCSAIYAVGETINSRIKIQNACDAAAYSAAVVQADGLSRMAIVNKAMSWTYAQMTNRQMDYITYRWLKLTMKRYHEDHDSAKKYAEQLILCVDPSLGWYAVLEAVISGIINALLDLHCDTGGHHKGSNPLAWNCSSVQTQDGKILFNGQRGALLNLFSLPTDPIESYALKPLGSIIDSGDNPSGWASRLGWLIDNDKKNIENLNNVLDLINQVTIKSMQATAESVLKSSLKDSRLESSKALNDYYINIRIPQPKNPYKTEEGEENTSYFSPLHNTEADERTFLELPDNKHSGDTLAGFFPVLFGKNSKQALGTDQWFIRGKGKYEGGDSGDDDPNDTLCYKAPAKTTYSGGKSGKLDGSGRLTGTVRDEGSRGIQRVYKDANLNEDGAGFIGNKVDRGNHVINFGDIIAGATMTALSFVMNKENETTTGMSNLSLGDGEYDNIDDALSALAEQDEDLELQEKKMMIAAATEDDPAKKAEYEQNVANIRNARQQLKESSNELSSHKGEAEKAKADAPAQKGGSSGGKGKGGSGGLGGGGGGGGQMVGDGGIGSLVGVATDLFNNFVGSLLDVDPSCENVNPKELFWPPMCTEANETTALYAQYRWASAKWYCCTKLTTWILSFIFNGMKIWCDIYPKTFLDLGLIKLKGNGYGHWSFPKWFDGKEPSCLLDGYIGGLGEIFLKYFPPLDPEDIKGADHGYMSSNWDISGFLKPLKQLTSNQSIGRDEYNSCAMMMDYLPFTIVGNTTYAALIRGHARIYGDDKEIFDNRYVGARCKPWVLNERFFAGEGTIIVGAAMKLYNPFVQVMNMMQGEGGGSISETSVLSAFNVPSGACMWTLSAARAGVRRHRRNAKYDQERMYQVVYDPTSDPENFAYNGSTKCILKKDAKDFSKKDSWQSVNSWTSENDEIARSRGVDTEAVWNGCVCSSSNKRQFENIWNLCEPDWDATLLPVRYSMVGALLLKNSDDDADSAIQKSDYEERRKMIDDMTNDDISDGGHWRWENTGIDVSGAVKILNVAGWAKASGTYFDLLSNFTDLKIDALDGPDLDTKFPQENGYPGRRFLIIMRNKIL